MNETRRLCVVHINVHHPIGSLAGTWKATGAIEGLGGGEKFVIGGERERTNWDDLQLRAAIASLAEARERGISDLEIHSEKDYLSEGFARFDARKENGSRTLAGNKVRNWTLWERFNEASEGLKLTFVVHEPLPNLDEVELSLQEDLID